MTLSPNQKLFATALASATGLSPQAIGAWTLAEEPVGAATTRGDQNWLNVGQFDSGPGALASNIQSNKTPQGAAKQTAAFLKGTWGGASPEIRGILKTAGQSPQAQLAAIANSNWASSHYGGAGKLQSLLRQVGVVPTGQAPLGTTTSTPVAKVPTVSSPSTPDIFNTLAGLEAARQTVAGDTTGTPGAVEQGWNLLGSLMAPNSQATQTNPTTPVDTVPTVRHGLTGLEGTDVNPLPNWSIGRTDMGVDASAHVGTPVRAPNNSQVVHIYDNWFRGQPYVLLRLTSGPNKGKYWYVSEQIDHLPQVGQYIPRNSVVARFAPSGTGIEIGWGTPGWQTQAQATTGYSEGQVTKAGQNFARTFGL